MTDDKPPSRRARFQIHLSTAIVLMFAIGFLMLANTSSRGKYEEEYYYMGYQANIDKYSLTYGWPRIAIYRDGKHFEQHRLPNGKYTPLAFTRDCNEIVSYGAIFLNTFNALSVVFVVWYACEWLIHRRALKKSA